MRHSASRYLRREATREPYDTVLIVCEGEKTEPNYFQDLKNIHRLSNANIVVASPGADPVTLVNYARDRLSRFNKIFCVFDGENVPRAAKAIGSIASSSEGKMGKWRAIVSTPCFEVWPLLHFEYTTSPFAATMGMTAGETVVARLRKHIPDYDKGMGGLYATLSGKLARASGNGRRLAKYNVATSSKNPATDMHELVDYLCGLKR